MCILRWMNRVMLKDRIGNAHIREILRVAPVDEKLRESRLRWFEHVCKRLVTTPSEE